MTPDLTPVLPPIGAKLRFKISYFHGTDEIKGSVVKVVRQSECGEMFSTSTSDGREFHWDFTHNTWKEGLDLVEEARANGIGGEEIPAGLPPLPPVPKGYDRWEYRGKGYDSSDLCVYAGFFEQYPEDGWRGIPDAPETLRGNVDAHYIEAVRDYKFRNVSCSQCGGEFGPGDHGFSHCADHSKQETESPKSSGNSGEVETIKTEEDDKPMPYIEGNFKKCGDCYDGMLLREHGEECDNCGRKRVLEKPTPPKPTVGTPMTDALVKDLEDSPVNIEIACEHLLDHARQLESDLAAARAENDRLTGLVDYAKQHGLIVGRAITTDQPEGYLAHDYREGSTLQRIFLEWSGSIGQDAEIQRLRAALEWASARIERVHGSECTPMECGCGLSDFLDAALAPSSSGKGEG